MSAGVTRINGEVPILRRDDEEEASNVTEKSALKRPPKQKRVK